MLGSIYNAPSPAEKLKYIIINNKYYLTLYIHRANGQRLNEL